VERGQYSPPSRNHPQQLPDYWRFEDGTIRRDLPELSDEELHELGWHGPIEMPPIAGTSYFTHNYEWNSETLSYDATELEEYEKAQRVNYQMFWDGLINTTAYLTIKEAASSSLLANTLATEFIALISDAKMGHANKEKIQESLTAIVSNIPFSVEEMEEIENVFSESGMFAIYALA
jgi:hypothetical protein